jgi:hypothetical protein
MAQGPYRRQFDIEAWRKRFKDTLAARFVLRFHMTLILACVIAAGVVTTRLLYAVGVTSMGLRYFASVGVAYGAFFLLIRAWLAYITDAVRKEEPQVHPHDEEVVRALAPDDAPHLGPQAGALGVAMADAGERQGRRAHATSQSSSFDVDYVEVDFSSSGSSASSASASPSASSGGASGGSSGGSGGGGGGGGGWGLSLDLDDGAAAILIIIVVAVVAAVVFGAAIYFVWEAPVILGEAAVEIVLASALVRSSRRIDRPGWTGSVLKATWIPATIVLVLATLGGVITQGVCPEADTLPVVIKKCVNQEKG